MKMAHILFIVALLIGAAGCNDPLGFDSDERNREREANEARAQEQRERESLALSLKSLASEKKAECASLLERHESKLAELNADSTLMTTEIKTSMTLKSPSGREFNYESKILKVLDNEGINKLALKYLGSDFSLAREDFMERVRRARQDEERYLKAIGDADAVHSNSTKDVEKWIDMSREKQEREIERLKMEIAKLESKWSKARDDIKRLSGRTPIGGRRMGLDRVDNQIVLKNRMVDIEREINKKRKQLDQLIDPDKGVRLEDDVINRTQRVQSKADINHRLRLYDIERSLKPKKTLADVVCECESNTIGKLKAELAKRIETAEANIAMYKGKLTEITHMEQTMPFANLRDLQGIRDTLLRL